MGGVLLVSGDRGDDLRALDRIFGGAAGHHVEAKPGKIAHALFRCRAIDVVKPHFAHAEQGLEGQRLEFGLGAIADQRHAVGTGRRQMLCRQRRHRRRAQCGRDGHFRQQYRVAVMDVGEHAEGGHRLAAFAHVLGMAVDIFEAVDLAVAGRHGPPLLRKEVPPTAKYAACLDRAQDTAVALLSGFA
jgi:hypothetical protein